MMFLKEKDAVGFSFIFRQCYNVLQGLFDLIEYQDIDARACKRYFCNHSVECFLI